MQTYKFNGNNIVIFCSIAGCIKHEIYPRTGLYFVFMDFHFAYLVFYVLFLLRDPRAQLSFSLFVRSDFLSSELVVPLLVQSVILLIFFIFIIIYFLVIGAISYCISRKVRVVD